MRETRADGAARPHVGSRGPYGKIMRPVGSEYVGKDGVAMVKVAEWPSRPGSKDNWRPKNRVAWERANGRPVPAGWVVVFCDHDPANFDPGNLLAAPRGLVAAANSMGLRWSDRATAEACLAVARLRTAETDLAMAAPRRCEVCGAEFSPPAGKRQNPGAKTCPACLAAGHKARGR